MIRLQDLSTRQIGPDLLDETYASDRPIDLPEDHDEAKKSGKLEEWIEWYKGLLKRQEAAHVRFTKKVSEQIELFGLAKVIEAIAEDDQLFAKLRPCGETGSTHGA